jgi:hypothetical protein
MSLHQNWSMGNFIEQLIYIINLISVLTIVFLISNIYSFKAQRDVTLVNREYTRDPLNYIKRRT